MWYAHDHFQFCTKALWVRNKSYSIAVANVEYPFGAPDPMLNQVT